MQPYDIRLGTDSSTAYDGDDPNVWQYGAGGWNRGALRLYYATSGGSYVIGSGGTNNNGNLLRQDHFVPSDDAVTSYALSNDAFSYDALNRVTSIAETTQTPTATTAPNALGAKRCLNW